jgi:hypothetical protein
MAMRERLPTSAFRGALLGGALAVAGCGTTSPPVGASEGGDGASDATSVVDTNQEPPVCDRRVPPCPTSAKPSYQHDVKQIVSNYCVTCHYPGSSISNIDYSTYAGVAAQWGQALSAVDGCRMPPADSPPMPSDTRTALMTWLACMAPNN